MIPVPEFLEARIEAAAKAMYEGEATEGDLPSWLEAHRGDRAKFRRMARTAAEHIPGSPS